MLSKINNSLNGRAILYTFGNFALAASNFLASVIFIRIMSVADYGLASVYITWVLLFSKIIGLRIEGTIQNAMLSYGRDKLRQYCSSVLALDLLFSLLILVISILFLEPISGLLDLREEFVVLAIVTSFFIVCSDLRRNYCSATKNAPGDLLVSCALAFGQIILSIVFIYAELFDSGYSDRVWGYSIPAVIIGLAICLFFFSRGRKFICLKYWRFCLSFSLPMILNGIAYLIINQSDRLLLNSLIGAEAAGIFAFSFSLAQPIGVITQSLGTAWQPEYYELKSKGKVNLLANHAKRYTWNVFLVAMLLMCITPEMLIILGTPEYYSGVPILPFIIAGYFFQFLYTWPVNCEMFYRKTIGITIATAVAAIANVLLNIALIPCFALMGSAIASSISFLLLFSVHHLFARAFVKDYNLRIQWFFPFIAGILVATISMFLLSDFLLIRWLVGAAVLGILVYRIKRDKSIV